MPTPPQNKLALHASRASPFSPALFTDLYELTMAQAYVEHSKLAQATFSLVFRKLPQGRGYLVFAGLADVLDYLSQFRFGAEDLDYLASLHLFTKNFLAYLDQLRFTGIVRAMEEGTQFFPDEPVLEITAPLVQAQLVETFIVNQIHLQSLLATKSARVIEAAKGRRVIDFSARRAHGIDAANKLARASYMVGFDGTSNLQAGALYAIPTHGTMAHSFVTACESEIDSFRKFAATFPESSIFLVDTFDTLHGVKNAITVAHEMRQKGHRLRAIRLDSGNLLDLSLAARAMLNADGLADVQIVVSGGLDEYEVERLLAAGAPIDTFAVGTKVGVSADAPYFDCAYKMVAYDGQPVLKLSAEKQTLPGSKQVFRRHGSDGQFCGDIIGCHEEPTPESSEPLLTQVMCEGRTTSNAPTLGELRRRFLKRRTSLPEQYRRLTSPDCYPVKLSDRLSQLHKDVVADTIEREGLASIE